MVPIAEPALALNDSRVGGRIRMSRNIQVRPDDMRNNILGCVTTVADGMPKGRLKSLVLNCHGAPGLLIMGEGFWGPHTGLFERWRGRVDNIWLTACEIASREQMKPGDHLAKGFGNGVPGDGYDFCREMAKSANCNVIASEDDQGVPHRRIPNGYIDAWEGTVMCFRPDGSFAWVCHFDLKNSE
jgi:hypothetical protein